MKMFLPLVVMVIIGGEVLADPITIRKNDRVDELTTKSGDVYKGALIMEITKTGVRIMILKTTTLKTIPAEELPQYKFLFDRIEGPEAGDNKPPAGRKMLKPRKPPQAIKWDKLTLKDGSSFKDVTVLMIHPDGVAIMHAKGSCKIPYEKLTEETQEKLGGFDPEQAKLYRQQLIEDQRRQAQQIAAIDKVRAANKNKVKQPEDDMPLMQPQQQANKVVKRVKGNVSVKLRKTRSSKDHQYPKMIWISATAGTEDMRVNVYSHGRIIKTYFVRAGERETFECWVANKYKVRAKEGGGVADEEGAMRKTGL